MTYTITATNVGSQPATGVTVTDTLPEGLTFVSCDPACDSSGLPVVIWTVDGELDVGDDLTFEVVATVDDPAAAGARRGHQHREWWTTTAPTAPTATPTTTPTPTPTRSTPPPTSPCPRTTASTGSRAATRVTYTVTVTNIGDQDAIGVAVVDTLPAGMTFVSCEAPAGVICDELPPGSGTVDAVIPLLAGEGGEVELAITVTVDDPVADGTTEFENTVVADHPADVTPDNNRDTDTDTTAPTSR